MTSLRKLSILLLAFIGLASLALLSLPSVYANIPIGQVDLKLVVVKGDLHDGGIDQSIPLPQFNYGSKASINVDGIELLTGKTFAFFVYKGELLTSRSTEFIVTDSTTVTAVFKGANEVVAVYVDTNGKVLDVLYGATGFTPLSDVTPLNKPGYLFSGFNDNAPISVDTRFVATYTKANTNPYDLTLNGGSASSLEPVFNEVVTLEPNPGNFSYWKDEDNFMISRNPNFQFTALKDTVISAVYDAVIDDEPLVYLSNVSGINPGYQSFLGYLEFNDGTYTLLEYGLLVSTDAKVLEKGMANVEVKPSGALAPTNEFLRSFVEDTYKSFRAYAIFDHEDGKVLKYSENNFGSTSELEYSLDFGLVQSSSYSDSDIQFLNLVDNTQFTINRHRVAINDAANTSGNATNRQLVLSPRADGINDGQSWVELNFSKNVSKIEFDSWYWSAEGNSLTTTFDFEVWNGTVWESMIDLKTDLNGTLVSKSFTYNFPAPITKVRFFSTRENQTANNNARALVDNVKVYSENSSKLFEVKLNDGVSTTSKSVSKNGLLTGVTTPTKEGYTFVRWLDENNQPFNLSTPIIKHMELTAEYEINQYTLIFDSNGGTAVAPFIGDYNTLVEVPSNPTKEGYTFAGWLPEIPTNVPSSNQTYVAQWTANEYTLTFDVDGGDAIAPLTQTYGSDLVLPIPTKSGFSFLGWYSDSGKTELFEEATMSLSKTIYAKWLDASSTSSVTFEVNGGSEIEPLIVVNGQAVTKPTDPTKSGFTFAGWFTDVELTNAFEFTTVINNDLDLYAKWVITVTFDANGGTPAIQTKVLNTPGTLSDLQTVTKSGGFDFVGWFDTNAETGGVQWTSETNIDSNVTFYARWVSNVTEIFATELFISEYIEGSSNNKVIEIFNGTGSPVTLSNYSVKLYTNGSSSAGSTLLLSLIKSTLNHGEVLVISNSQAGPSFKPIGFYSHGVAGFNGDDAIALLKNDVVIDQFGVIGTDPGSSWNIDGITTVDKTLVRKASVTGPNSVWTPSEWIQYNVDTSSYLGSHVFNPQ